MIKRSVTKIRPTKNDKVFQPMEEEDLLKIKELLKEKSQLVEYIKSLSLFRMSILGYTDKDESNLVKLDAIIDRVALNRDDIYGEILLPENFETARRILLKLREERDFNRILEEVRSIV